MSEDDPFRVLAEMESPFVFPNLWHHLFMMKEERRAEQILADEKTRRAWCDARADFEALTREAVSDA